MTTVASATIDSAPGASGTWATTDYPLEGYFNISISGTITPATTTVTVQRSLDGSNWFDVDTFTKATEDYGFEPELMYYRIGIKNGDYTAADDVDVRIGREAEERY